MMAVIKHPRHITLGYITTDLFFLNKIEMKQVTANVENTESKFCF